MKINDSVQYRNFYSMGTRIDIILPGIDDHIAESVCLQIKSELDRIEEKISHYKESSVVSYLNQKAHTEPIKTDPEIFLLINQLIGLSARTSGYFDFGLGFLSENMKHASETYHVVHDTMTTLSEIGARNIVLDHDENSVLFKSDKLKIDSGGFGKGYGLDTVKKILKALKIESAFISFGESSILALGDHPYGKSWKTGIQDIFSETSSLFVFTLANEALSVSGVNPKNKQKYGVGHIINPHTGIAIDCFRQSAVAGNNGLIAEVVSTAILCAPDESRHLIMEQFPEYRAIVIDYDQTNKPTITYTCNLNDGENY